MKKGKKGKGKGKGKQGTSAGGSKVQLSGFGKGK